MKNMGAGVVLTLGLGLAACGGDDAGPNGASSGGTSGGSAAAGGLLAKSVQAPADATCPLGGTSLQLGLDKNQNGTLDADEVQTTQTVCNNPSAPTLTAVTPSGASDKCKNGGTTVTSGADKNGNGKLDADEIETTEEICSGGASATLAVTSAIAAGDDHCPAGGTKTDAGLDNGAGTAGNGVLDPAEITTTTYACSGGFAPIMRPPLDPSQPASIYRASGGTGSVGAGGNGGDFTVLSSRGTTSNVIVFDTGTADASFTPHVIVPRFGAVKLDVTSETVVLDYSIDAVHPVGEYYMVGGSGAILRQVTASTTAVVTGIHVAPGGTLTLPSYVALEQDFHLEGTLTTALVSGSRTSLYMEVAQFRSDAGAHIRLEGAPVAGAAGGNGGSLEINARAFSNAADIDTFGAVADDVTAYTGGNAGSINLYGYPKYIESTGVLDAHGAAGKAGGGSGSSVVVQGKSAAVSGRVDTSGGNGGGSGGGNAGTFLAYANGGSVMVSAALQQNGGDADAANCATCSGGQGGLMQLLAYGGSATSSAAVSAHGGKGSGGAGGKGGNFYASIQPGSDSTTGTYLPAGIVAVSGAHDRRGGDGATGGMGGVTQVSNTGDVAGGDILFYGQSRIETSGGNGVTEGGAGGMLRLNNTPSGAGAQRVGSVVSYASVGARGGNAAAGVGKRGGMIDLRAGSASPLHGGASLLIRAAIDVGGGNGTATAGMSGPITMFALDHVEIASIDATGGNATSGVGASTSTIQITAGAGLNGTGAITARGGNGAAGGSCSYVSIGSTESSVGDLACKGGNGNGGAGGNGGNVMLYSTQTPAVYGTLSAAAGNGAPNGTPGSVYVDGVRQP